MKRRSQSSVTQLAELSSTGSVRYQPPTHSGGERVADVEERQPKFGLINLDKWLKSIRKTGAVKHELQSADLDSSKACEAHRAQTTEQTVKHGIDLNRVVIDDGLQRRAQRAIAGSAVQSAIELTDAIEVVALYHDAKIARMNEAIKDEEIRKAFAAEIRLHLSQQLMQLRVLALGLDHPADLNGEGVL